MRHERCLGGGVGARVRSEGDGVPALLNKLQSATAACARLPFFLPLFGNYSLSLSAFSEEVASSAAPECVFSVVIAGRV